MKRKRAKWAVFIVLLTALLVGATVFAVYTDRQTGDYGFARDVSAAEAALRLQVARTAESWYGASEHDNSHGPIIDRYNSHRPLAQGYLVQYSDDWCATFVSFVAIECGLTDIIPTECGCQRQIALFQKLCCWEERDDYTPLPGDIIYYSSKRPAGDSTAWSDHVGIVVGTRGRWIKVIEGNWEDKVEYRIIRIDDSYIRGYGLPDYGAICE